MVFYLQVSEDGIQLLYRPNGIEDWTIYPYCTKKMGSTASDKRIISIIKSITEYTTGNLDPLS